MTIRISKLVSGGQTGVDRAALDFAIRHGIPHGGWCPADRLAEDGPIASCYALTETPTRSYSQRTQWNVRDSDGTVVFSIAALSPGGTRETATFSRAQNKPILHLSRASAPTSPERTLLDFIRRNRIRVLNVAGPRASTEPEVAAFVQEVLERWWLEQQ